VECRIGVEKSSKDTYNTLKWVRGRLSVNQLWVIIAIPQPTDRIENSAGRFCWLWVFSDCPKRATAAPQASAEPDEENFGDRHSTASAQRTFFAGRHRHAE
jgi:hypothetical protein